MAEWEEPRHSGRLVVPPYPTLPHHATPFPTFPSGTPACPSGGEPNLALQSGLTAELQVGRGPANEPFSLQERLQDVRPCRNQPHSALLG